MEIRGDVSSLKCPICGGTAIVKNEEGDYVCATCGYVILEAREVEFDAFEGYGEDSKPLSSRGNLVNTLHDKGLGSVIDGKTRNPRFKKLARANDRMKFGSEAESFLGDVKKGIDQFSSLIARTLGTPLPSYIINDAYAVSDLLYNALPKKYRKSSIEFRRYVGLATILAVVKEYGSYLPPEIILNNLDLDKDAKKLVKDLYTYIHNNIVKKRNSRVIDISVKMKEMADVMLRFLKHRANVMPERETLILEGVEKVLNALRRAKKGEIGSRYISSYIGGALYLVMRVLATSQRAMVTQEVMAKKLSRGPNSLRNAYVEIFENTLIVVEVPAKAPRIKGRKKRVTRGVIG